MFEQVHENLKKFFTARPVIMMFVMVAASVVLIVRLFNLQIVHGEDYQNSFQLKIRKEKDIASTRGNIYDRNGNLLAYNELADCVMIEDVFETGRGHNAKINETIDRLIDILEKNGDHVVSDFNIALDENNEFEYTVSDTAQLRFIADAYGRSSIGDLKYEEKTKTAEELVADLCTKFGIGDYTEDGKTFLPGKGYTNSRLLKVLTIRYDMNLKSFQKYIDTMVASSVSEKSVADIYENADDLQGVSVVEETARKYVDAQYFSQIIGYTGKISQDELETLRQSNPDYSMNDTVGKSGIEQAMELTLQGKKGLETVYVDKLGKVIETSDYVNPIAGNNVYVTIDMDLQEACYDILEERLAGILVSKIRNIREAGEQSGSNMIIPITDVYFTLFNNTVIDTKHFTAKDAGETEQAVQVVAEAKLESVLERLHEELYETKTPYNKLSKEYQVYESYYAANLYDRGILNRSKIDTEDETYQAWTTEETISLNEFLYYAIANGWVNVSGLKLENQYSDSSQIFDAITAEMETELRKDVTFSKKFYKYLLLDNAITGKQVCNLLLEQKIVTLSEEEAGLWEAGAESAYNFMLARVENLDITPAQLNLDPCTGSMVITDVNTGDVLALVSYPSYDNNKMANGVDAEYFASLRADLSKPLINYATQQKTAPGSTFKMVSATAGLSEQVISTTSTYVCRGIFDLINPSPKCWIHPGAHGALNVTGGIRHSCNVFFYELGYHLGSTSTGYSPDLGLEKLRKYADMYGLTEKSGVEIDESEPQVSDFDAVRSAIGQGTNSFTTVQLARYVTTVANSGTCYNLTLLDKVTDSSGSLLEDHSATVRNQIQMDSSYWDAIHLGMRQVVEDKTYFNDIGVDVAGKTGTAQESKSRPNHALFVCYAPYDKPQIAIATRIANGYTSSYAAQITGDVIRYYFHPDQKEDILSGTAQELEGGRANAD